MVSTLVSIYFGRLPHGYTMKTNFIPFETVDPEICSILIFYKRVWYYLLHHFRIIFEKIVYDFLFIH